MATIRTAIQIQDGMSPAFRAMNNAMNIVINSFESLQSASGHAVDTRSIQTARQELARAETAFNGVEQQIREANQAQNEFNNSVRNGGGASDALLGKLKSLATGIGIAFGVDKVIKLADSMTSTKAKLDLINDGLQTTEELQNMIVASANRSRASYQSTADVVGKLGILAGRSFKSNEEMVAFTELMNKNFVIGGASIQEQTSAMYQLTQAMAAGKLQGDEFRSIMENAPLLAQAIADYMGKPMGAMKQLSADGAITADIIKAAMFKASDQVNERFAKMPMTFAQVGTILGNTLLQAFQPVIQGIGLAAQWIYDNWSTLAPIFLGLAAAVGVYAAAMGISNAVTWLGIAANRALMITMLQNPIGWIALLIGVLIGFIYKWVQSVGGLKVAWMICMNAILTAWDWVKIGFFTGIYFVLDLWDKLKMGMMSAGVAIANFMGDMKASVLMILQNMVNGAIDIINGFIGILNKIPGVNIGLISQVTFGTDAKLKNEAEKQARNAGLDAYKSEISAGMADRDAKLQQMQADARDATAKRQTEIDAAKIAAKNKAAEDNKGFDWNALENSSANTAANTAKMSDSMDMATDSLEYMRDVAEQEVINKFTTAEITMNLNNTFGDVRETVDLDGVVTYLEDKFREALETSAEGIHE